MAYTKRTCHHCGYRDIQPNMYKRTVKHEIGSSNAKLSKRALLTSTIFGSDRGARQVKNWASGNTSRSYVRNRQVWVCYDCDSEFYESSSSGLFFYVKGIFYTTLVFLAIGFILS